jgi:MoxR-like ATPase
MSRFEGTDTYIVDEELGRVVDVAIRLELPLLLKGEPGTGKTLLAHAVATARGLPLIQLNTKSSMKAVEALYQYDTLTRLNDSRFGDSSRDVSDINQYIRMGKIGQAFTADERCVLLIDEIDKADGDFQDDLLDVLDQMAFDIVEVDRTVTAKHRPVIIITSNAKKDLSDPFLGRCVFHHIAFPTPEFMRRIVDAHFPELDRRVAQGAVQAFYRLRAIEGVEKAPATRELLHWIRAVSTEPGFNPRILNEDNKIPLLGVLFKKSEDLSTARRRLGQR